MRILHVISSLEIGGAQRLLSDLLPLQKKLGNVVELLVFMKTNTAFQKSIEANGIKIVDLRCENFYNPLIVSKLIPYMKQYDIVHVHLFPALYWVALAASKCSVRLIYTEHSTHNKRRNKLLFSPIERYIYNKYDKLISISQQTQENLIKWLKAKQVDRRFVVIENGVNLDLFSDIPSALTGKKQIIMVSRFAQMKDQETVIRAMVDVSEDVELVLVGDGPNKVHCEEVARELNLTERVIFLGARSDIPNLVAQAYIGVQSSIWEGFGLTAVELMAARKPVIATNVNGLRQVVEGAGYLFEVGDIKALALYINKILKDECLYTNVADRCYERAKHYDIGRMIMCYQEVYNDLYG